MWPNDEIDEDDCVEFDKYAINDVLADDTREGLPVPEPPTGYELEPAPSATLKMSNLKGKKVLWAVPACRDGKPGWIKCEVFGGPPDPTAAAQGITVQLRCSTRDDQNTPTYLLKDRPMAAFQLSKYYGTGLDLCRVIKRVFSIYLIKDRFRSWKIV